jgi:Putative prokaryotic signal transducing protein
MHQTPRVRDARDGCWPRHARLEHRRNRGHCLGNRDMSDTELVVIGTFLNQIDADMAQGALEAADIKSMISADDAGGLRPHLWMGGIRLLVRAEDAKQASEILARAE